MMDPLETQEPLTSTDWVQAIKDSLIQLSLRVKQSDPSEVAKIYIELKKVEKSTATLIADWKETASQYLDDGELLEWDGKYLTYQMSERKGFDVEGFVQSHPSMKAEVDKFRKVTSVKSLVVKDVEK